jgi:hypothetical protein
MSKLSQDLGLVLPHYRRPWTLYVHGLGLWGRYESRAEGEQEAHKLRLSTRGTWQTFGPVFEPNTEVYDLTFGALRKDAPKAVFKAL